MKVLKNFKHGEKYFLEGEEFNGESKHIDELIRNKFIEAPKAVDTFVKSVKNFLSKPEKPAEKVKPVEKKAK